MLKLHLLAGLLVTSAAAQTAIGEETNQVTCVEQLRLSMPHFLDLSPKDFEFDEQKGWRTLSRRGCYKEAGEALTTYISKKELPYHMYFHAGQMLASAGDYRRAVDMLDKSLRPNDEDSPFKWNAYVRAIRAFLARDRALLERQRQIMAERADIKGNEMNLRVVDKLIANFDKSYVDAVR